MEDHQLDRRRLAKGIAWSVPIIAVASMAPAVAASPVPALSVSGRGTYNRVWYTEDIDGRRDFKLFSTPPRSNSPGQGFCIENTNSSTQISNARVIYHLPYYDLRFRAAGPGGNGWSVLSRDESVPDKSFNGVRYYAYTTTYQGAVTPVNGRTCLPAYGFESNGSLDSTGYFFVDHWVQVNGQALRNDAGRVSMSG